MKPIANRRNFLKWTAGLAAACARPSTAGAQGKVVRTAGTRVKLGLNAYSFNQPLMAGTLKLEDVIHYCAEIGIEGVDPTGYYFPGYPKTPPDDYIYHLKREAFLNGVTLSGTGVRNDFTAVDAAARKKDVQLVKDWIEVAAKLGAPVIRVFTGPRMPEGHSFDEVLAWMTPDFKECAAHGKRFGVIVGLQNHNDFVKTAGQAIRVIQAVDSEWFGSILDIGSLRTNDPYEEIEKLMPYAVSWQLKEMVGYGTKEVPTDLAKVKAIIDKGGYRGFLPVETLGGGDPKVKVAAYMEKARKVFGG
ncbi:MAG: TIM barrel protein [Bryobacteraceae bacterium]